MHFEYREPVYAIPTLFERCSLKKLLVLSCLLVAAGSSALADNFLYGNSAGTPTIFKIDKTTGNVVATYTNLSGGNGRGVVVVGTTMYYTAADTGSVYSYNLATNTNNGALFTVAGASGLSTIAFDGTDFWIGDYSGTDHVYHYTTGGALIGTLSLGDCSSQCDGLEYFQQGGTGYLISNRGDTVPPYDVYNLNGTLKTADFLNATGSSTGIAFDGTDFFTSNIFNQSLSEWDGTTGAFIKTIPIIGETGLSEIEDLSADYSQVLPPPPPSTVPEPSTFILVGSSMLGLAGAVKRRFARSQK
jgi:hypothetical protein